MSARILSFTLNGELTEVAVAPFDMLVDVLRDKLNLIGAKKGCGQGECGACTVIMNGEAVTSCIVPALKAQGAVVETIEGIGSPDKLHPLQESFMDLGAIQCGFCTPGISCLPRPCWIKTNSPPARRSGKPYPVTSAAARGTSK